MKKKQFLFFLLFALAKLLPQKLTAQAESNYGNWFYESSTSNIAKIYPKTHFEKPTVFPGTGVRGNNHKLTFSTIEKTKFQNIIYALKEVYPKPKYHSMVYWMFPQVQGSFRTTTQTMVDKRQYRFNYFIGLQYQFMALKDGKPVAKFDALQFGREFDFLNINVNSFPDFLGGKKGDFDNQYFGPLFKAEEDFTYKKYNGERVLPINGSEERIAFPRYPAKDLIISITNRAESFAEAEKYLGKNFGLPTFQFGNEADNHFVYRTISSSRLRHSGEYLIYGKVKDKDLPYDKYNLHTVHNMVILSHNNQLPFKPLTIKRFLEIADDILNESIEYTNQYFTNESAKKEHSEELQNTKTFVQSLRSTYSNKLQEPAIVDVRYSHVSDFASGYVYTNNKTKHNEILNLLTDKRETANEVLSKFFITDAKFGKAFYSYDREFYKGMGDGEIRTIAVIWKDYIRVPDHKDFGKGFQIENDEVLRNRFSDNPDHYLNHFNKKFDWKKLEALLGK